uniref:Uncharacterized protein n=1 Tax=Anopheles melas TaxID=34690 RepID=A0A182TGX5_9DIPT
MPTQPNRFPPLSTGSVRAESFSRPRSLYQNGVINDAQESRQESFGTECTPDPTMGEVLQENGVGGGGGGPGDTLTNVLSEEEEEELLEKLANRHYYSYTAALGVTVGVGCLLLLLNMLIFAGIYYQRDRTKRKSQTSQSSGTAGGSGVTSGTSASLSGSNGTPDESEIPLTSIPSPSPVKAKRTIEPPPSYATLPKRTGNNGATGIHHQHQHHHHLHQHLAGGSGGTKETKLGSPPTSTHLRTGASTLGRSGTGSFYDSSTSSRQQQQQSYSTQQLSLLIVQTAHGLQEA